MSKHNDIYNILGKLTALAPKAEPKPSVLKELAEPPKMKDLATRLNERYLAEKGQITKTATGLRHEKTDWEGNPSTFNDTDSNSVSKSHVNKMDNALGVKFDKEKKFQGGVKVDEISQGLAGRYMNAAEKDIKSRKEKDTWDPKIGKRKEGKFHAVLRKTGTVPTTDDPTHGKFLQREDEMDEDMLSPKQKKFANLAPPKDKITYADKIAGAKKKIVDEEFEDQDNIENKGEYDQEGDMAKDDLSTIEDAARELDSILSADDNLPEWVQGKITKAMDYLDTARDYMKSNTDDDNQINEDLQADDGEHYKNADDFFSKFEAGWFDDEQESDDGMEVRGYIDGVNVMVWRYDNKRKTSGYGVYNDDELSEGEYQDKVDKSKIPAFQRKAKGGDDWKLSTKDLDDEASKSPTSAAGLEKAKQRMRDQGVMEGFPTVDDAKKRHEQEKGTGKFDKQTTSTGTRYTRKPETFAGDDDTETTSSDAPKKKGRPKKNSGPERVTSKAWKHKGGRVSEAMRPVKLDTFVEDTLAEMDELMITEKAVSKQQQKFMGMVHAMQKGEKVKGASEELKAAAKGMSKKDVKDFAGTKHKGLPDHVTESLAYEAAEKGLNAICHRYGKECNEFMTTGNLDDDLYHALYDYYFDDMPYGVKKARDGDPYEWISDRFYDDMGGSKYDGGDDSLSPIPPSIDIKPTRELDELAKLAGLGEVDHSEYIKQQDDKAERSGRDHFNAFNQLFNTDEVNEGSCNMTAEGQYCPEHGMNECGSMMYEGKPDFLDMDKDGDKEEPMKKAVADKKKNPFGNKKELDECGPMGPMGGEQPEGMSVNSSFDTKTGRKTLSVTADGEAAEQLAQMLKLSGLGAGHMHNDEHEHEHGMMGGDDSMDGHKVVLVTHGGGEEEMEEDFSNEPNEQYATTDTIIDAGQDLNRKKQQYADKPKAGDNPMATEDVTKLEGKLAALYDSIKVKVK